MEKYLVGTSIQTLELPNSITNLTGEEFNRAMQLKTIILKADNPNYIVENGALYSKDKTVLVTYINNKETTINLPEGLTKITAFAFGKGSTATQINLPSSLEIIDNWALENLSQISKIVIPQGVKTIGIVAMPRNLKEIIVAEENATFKSIDNSMIVSKDEKILWCVNTKATNINIPSTVEIIKRNAFYGNISEEITLPANIKTIEYSAFRGCSNLKKIEIGNKIETIGGTTFTFCNNLTQIIIDKEKGSIEGMPWGCPYGERAVIWKQ